MYFLGLALIFLSLSFLGISRGAKLRAERDRMYEIRKLICFLQTLLQNGSPETRELFAALQKDGAFIKLPFLKELSFSLHRAPQEVWGKALLSSGLSLEERELLSPVGQILGRYDSLTQQRQLEQLLLTLPPIIEKREEKVRTEGKLFQSGGVLLGFLAVILLA